MKHQGHKPEEWTPHRDNARLEVRFCTMTDCTCMDECCSEVRWKASKKSLREFPKEPK